MVPAGDDRRELRERGHPGPGQNGDRAPRARPDPGRRGPAAGGQPHLPGRLGEPGAGLAAARRRDRRTAPAGSRARPEVRPAPGEDPAVHRRGAPAVLAGLPVPADPGGAAGARRDGAADHGEPVRLPGGDRAGPAGHPLRAAVRHRRRADARLPAADHAAGGEAAAPAGDRLLRRGPGRPGRPGGAVRPAASRCPGHPDADRQRGRHGHRGPPPGQPHGRGLAGDQPQLPAPDGHLQRPGAGHPQRAGRGQHRRHHRRGRR